MARIITETNSNRKDIILKNAAALFRRNGFKSSSMRELADSLNIEAPSLYNHFRSKAELLRGICFSVAEDFTTHIVSVNASTASSHEKVTGLISFHIKKMHSEFDNVYVSNHEWKHLQPEDLEHFLSQRRQYENVMTSIITAGIKSKELRTQNPRVTVLTILSAVRGLEFWQRHKKELSIKELEQEMISLLIGGIINTAP
jgi:AcrR family transcriptional regulator